MLKKVGFIFLAIMFVLIELFLTFSVVFAPFAYMNIMLVIIGIVFFVVLKKKPKANQLDFDSKPQ